MAVALEAIAVATDEMGEFAVRLPEVCSYTIDQILDDNFWLGNMS